MGNDRLQNRILSVFFLAFLLLSFVLNGFWPAAVDGSALEGVSLRPDRFLAAVKLGFLENLWAEDAFIKLNGSVTKAMDMRSYYSSKYGFYLNDDGMIVSVYPQTSTDYEYEQLLDFRDFLAANGIRMLYVSLPNKYLDDAEIRDEFSTESYCNRNVDRLLERLRAADVPVLDLREDIVGEKLNVSDLFYRTDHHWTVEAAFWAARRIAVGGLDRFCGYDIDPALYDKDRYLFRHWESCWVGEQGRKLSESYVGWDDYTLILPDFPTHYRFKSGDGTFTEGGFEGFIDTERLNGDGPVPGKGLHYAYRLRDSVNLDAADGKVLLLRDSFSNPLAPFLSLGIRELDTLALRSYDSSFDLRERILREGYDTVLICYSTAMIGAHDTPESANYRMFDFH